MHQYLYAQRSVHSTIALPELSVSSSLEPDFRISRIDAPVTPTAPLHWDRALTIAPQPGDPRCARVGDAFALSFPGTAEVWIPAPGDVQVWQHPDASAESIRHVLLDHVMPRVLADAGALVLHGSAAVTLRGACVVLLADSGSGKSTLASAIALAGGELLTDDCFHLSRQGAQPVVIPTYSGLRLWPDSLQALFGADGARSEPMSHNSAKRRLSSPPGGRPSLVSAPVDAIFVLEPASDATGILATPLGPSSACMALVRNSFRLDLGSHTAAHAALAETARVIDSMPVLSLRYRRDYAMLPALIEQLEQIALAARGRTPLPTQAVPTASESDFAEA